jgi:hypothetical protein
MSKDIKKYFNVTPLKKKENLKRTRSSPDLESSTKRAQTITEKMMRSPPGKTTLDKQSRA